MKEYLLRKAWKNDILKCIQEIGLNALDFEFCEEKTELGSGRYPVSVLKHEGSDFYFKFDRTADGDFAFRFYPGNRGVPDESELLEKWNEILPHFNRWLSYLKEEVGPDLWEQMKTYAPVTTFTGTAVISNEPFSYSKVEEIIGALDELRVLIKENLNLELEQLDFVKKEFEDSKERAKRVGRKDWILAFIGVIVTIITGFALSPDKAKLLWDLAKSRFGGILPLPGP